jgi:Ecdysteroid kinase-like family
MTAFPRHADEVTAVWLTEMLQAGGALEPDRTVDAFSVEPLGAGFGQTSDAVRILLDVGLDSAAAVTSAPTAGRSVVAKFPTGDEARRAASVRAGLYRCEVQFYRDLAPRVGTRVPHCLYAELDDDGASFALFLEDFPDHRPGDETTGCSPADARRAVVQIGALHGAFWMRAAEAGVAPGALPPVEALARAWDTLEEGFGAELPAQIREVRDDYLAALPRLHAWITGTEQTVIHGDFRLDNLLFGTPGTKDELVVVDWQAVRGSKGIHDFTYLVTHSMNTEERRAHEQQLLQTYVETLAAHGVDYPMCQAVEDYPRAMLYLLWTVLWIVGVNVNTHERAIRRKRALVRRASQAILDHDALRYLSTPEGPR